MTKNSVLASDEPVRYDLAPEVFATELEDYIEHGIYPGGLLVGVLINDLYSTLAWLDGYTLEQLIALAKWIDEYAPPDCFGAPASIGNWIKRIAAAREREVLSVLRESRDGLTIDEIAERLNHSPVSVSPRLKLLLIKGLVVDTGLTKDGPEDRARIVWRAK